MTSCFFYYTYYNYLTAGRVAVKKKLGTMSRAADGQRCDGVEMVELGWNWWLVMEWCERKTLLAGC